MSPFNIRCYRNESDIPTNCFFILNKGKNAGRPSRKPNPNCFVLSCENVTDLETYYWLVYALYTGQKFYPFFCGSVIDFIRIDDCKKLIREHALLLFNRQMLVDRLGKLDHALVQFEKQLKMIRQLKEAYARAAFQPE